MSREICRKIKLCTGCTACMSVCPKNCIEMKADDEGFVYPVVNEDICINCNMCEKACPINYAPMRQDYKLSTYVARTSKEKFLDVCTSGGVVTAISESFVDNGGVVYGAVYSNDFEVIHKRIDNVAEIEKLAGSKYVQSNLKSVFADIKSDLNKGLKVLFCGTPCQTAGLINYLENKRDRLYCVDLVCHGVPSPKLWKDYVSYLQKKNGLLVYSNFRSKYLGYHVSVMEERFGSGKVAIGSARTNLMSKCFFKNIADRYSCYDCQFKTVERCSDITVYDSWHASELVKGLRDDDKGYTNIIIQSLKGEKLLKEYSRSLIIYKVDTDTAIKLDGAMAVKSVQMPSGRKEFYSTLNNKGIELTVDEMLHISKSDYIIEKAKIVLHKIGILKVFKYIKSKIN